MSSPEANGGQGSSGPPRRLDSPYLRDEPFARPSGPGTESTQALVEAESPYGIAFEAEAWTSEASPDGEVWVEAEEEVFAGETFSGEMATGEISSGMGADEVAPGEVFVEEAWAEEPTAEEVTSQREAGAGWGRQEGVPAGAAPDAWREPDVRPEASRADETAAWGSPYGAEEARAEPLRYEGPTVPVLDDYLLYLETLVDEEVFDEETRSAEQEWRAVPAIHRHFHGDTPQERFARYLELRPLYRAATGASDPAAWIARTIVSVSFLGKSTPAHRDLAAPLAAAEDTLRRGGSAPRVDWFWGFVPRAMRTRAQLSNHALGLAVDIDHKTNPHIHHRDEIRVILAATGVDLGLRQTHDALYRASARFREAYGPAWLEGQPREVRDAAARQRVRLDGFARSGFLTLDPRLVEALIGAGFVWGGDWQSEKDFMHFDLPQGGRSATSPPPAPGGPAPAASGSGGAVAPERVRFVQSVLNATQRENLKADGAYGPLTRAALERFRGRHGLGTGGGLDERTELALVQRALEEIRQQSLFGAPGTLDTATREVLTAFRAERGLGSGAIIDDATRAALAAAVERRAGGGSAPVGVQPTGAPPPAAPGTAWERVAAPQRMAYVVARLVERYGYPVAGAAGIVGNLWGESGVIPSRLEGSRPETPLRAASRAGTVRDFTPEEVMDRRGEDARTPRRGGVGLAQWTQAERRRGLFQHSYEGRTPGAAILFDMDAQIDYLVTELRGPFRGVDRVLRAPGVTIDAASDEVLYNFEVPGSILDAPDPAHGNRRRKLPRSDARVQTVFERRRRYSLGALQAFRGGR
jgi:peptidoglycan hydrolase-like protein with peptidoglycan-binding domain